MLHLEQKRGLVKIFCFRTKNDSVQNRTKTKKHGGRREYIAKKIKKIGNPKILPYRSSRLGSWYDGDGA